MPDVRHALLALALLTGAATTAAQVEPQVDPRESAIQALLDAPDAAARAAAADRAADIFLPARPGRSDHLFLQPLGAADELTTAVTRIHAGETRRAFDTLGPLLGDPDIRLGPTGAFASALLARTEPGAAFPWVRLWETELDGLLEIDARGERVRALLREPQRLVTLDETGAIAHTVEIEHPHGLHIDNGYNRPLVVLPEGGFHIGPYRFGDDGRSASELPFNQAVDLALDRGGGVLRLHESGIFSYGRSAETVTHWSAAGKSVGRLDNPQAFDVAPGGSIVVAEAARVQTFDASGNWQRAVLLPPYVRPIDHYTWIRDVAVGPNGYVYLAVVNRAALVVLDPELRHVAIAPIVGDQIEVDARGRLYVKHGKRLTAYAPLDGGVAPLTRPSGEGLETVRLEPDAGRRRIPVSPRRVELTREPSPAPPWKVHTGTRRVRRVRPDPTHPEVVWAATHGGLVRWDRRTDEWRTWNHGDGLPHNDLLELWPDDDRVWLISPAALALFENDRFYRLRIDDERR